MPSVGMRRTTRVFGARVLRSGRRLFPTQEEVKHMRRAPLAVADADEGWIELLDHGGAGGVELKENGWRNSNEEIGDGTDDVMDIDDGDENREYELGKLKEVDLVGHDHGDGGGMKEVRHWGLVYTRKRKREVSIDSGLKCNSSCGSDKKYGKKFIRKQARKKIISKESNSVVSEELPSVVTTERDQTLSESLLALKAKSGRKKPRISVSKSIGQNLPPRNGITIRSSIQKRRSSLRSRKRRNPSSFGMRKAGEALVSDLLSKKDGVPFFPIKSNLVISRPVQKANVKELKSTLVELTQDLDSASCNVSILVIESDRCYRESGAVVTMEKSDHQQWFLVVKRNGIERLRLAAQHVMRPCFCNRITRAIIWAAGDDSWRLEFPTRQDWFVFKELYRKCSKQSVPAPAASVIPVPRVSQVLGYAEEGNNSLPFRLPSTYICSRGDELARALEKSYPIYDMDSEDDEWLSKFNNERCQVNEPDKHVSEDTFEKIIDAFERGIYCSPDEYSDVALAVDRCLTLASKEVLEAIYGYWMDKRKKKQSALIRVFQFYQPKRDDQLSFKAILRKKRSFKRKGNQSGRGKQLTFLKVAHDKKVEEEASIKVQETKDAARRAEQAAIGKRERAQTLMQVADMLTYKANMALRIAESRAADDVIESSVYFFLDE